MVLPLPRKPVTTVTGILRLSIMARLLLDCPGAIAASRTGNWARGGE